MSLFKLATFQVLSSHMWPVAAVQATVTLDLLFLSCPGFPTMSTVDAVINPNVYFYNNWNHSVQIRKSCQLFNLKLVARTNFG